ncbi:MAG: class II aldolase/adducin family protein [Pseudomonadota bacterium]
MALKHIERHTESKSVSSPIDLAKEDLALAHRIIAYENMHEGTWNHLSVMSPDDDALMLVSRGSLHFSDIYAEDILIMDGEGNVHDASAKPNQAAWCLHYPIHMRREDAKCVIHLHSLNVCALLMQRGTRLDEQGSQPAATLYQHIAYYDSYDGVLRDASEGEQMADVLGECSILALRNHGFIAIGPSIAVALERAYLFERACQMQLLAESSGRELNRIPDDLIAEISKEENLYLGGYFDGMKRLFENKQL